MNHRRPSASLLFTDVNAGGAFKAHLLGISAALPAVSYFRSAGYPQRTWPMRSPPRLSCVAKAPVAFAASPTLSSAAARSAKNIAAWSAFLPADCVAAMILLGWDRTT